MQPDLLQRSVGFEYELDSSYVTVAPPPEKGFFSGLFDSSKTEEPTKLDKGLVLSDLGNFDLSVDKSPEGDFDLEIRIKEVSDTDQNAKQNLLGTVDEVAGVLQSMSMRGGLVPASAFGGPKDVRMGGDFTAGSLQATAGLNLTALHAFLSGEMGQRNERRMNALGRLGQADASVITKALYTRGYGQVGSLLFQRAHEVVAQQYSQLSESEQNEVAAVVTSIATIPCTARSKAPLKYAKSATTLLAKSDYATIINELPSRVFSFISSQERWRFLVMQAINGYLFSSNLPQASFDDPIFPEGSVEGESFSLKLGEWLTTMFPASVETQKDLLTSKNYPVDRYQDDNPAELESLGGLGAKADLGAGGQKRPIFEFRKYLLVPLNHLPVVIDGIWDLISEANRLKKKK